MLGDRNCPSWTPILKLLGVCRRCHKYGCGSVGSLSYWREYIRTEEEQWEGIQCLTLVVLWGRSYFLLESTVLPSVVMLATSWCSALVSVTLIKIWLSYNIKSWFLTRSTKATQAVGVHIFSNHLRPSWHYLKILPSVNSFVSLQAKVDPPFSSRSITFHKFFGVSKCKNMHMLIVGCWLSVYTGIC